MLVAKAALVATGEEGVESYDGSEHYVLVDSDHVEISDLDLGNRLGRDEEESGVEPNFMAGDSEWDVEDDSPVADVTYYDWSRSYFRHGETRDNTEPRGHAIRAIKREVVYTGTSRRVNVDHAVYGDAMLQATKDFQRSVGLTPDGVIGARTCKALFRPRLRVVEETHGIPNAYVCRMTDLESAFYPAARNSGKDTGLAQINLNVHAVTEAQAYDPAFALPWAAERLEAAHEKLAKLAPKQTWTRKWWAAIYAHNAPAFADDWLLAGCPATGGPTINVGGKDWDGWEWATLYVGVVLNRTC